MSKDGTNVLGSKDKKSIGISLGLNIKGNQDMLALSSASKMSKHKNKIPRGATGVMPGKSMKNDLAKTQIIRFKQQKSNEKKETLQVEEKESPISETEQYDVEVTQPPQYQLNELEAMDDSSSHPRMRYDAPTTGIDVDHLVPDMDKQRRRESVVLDEDGDEFKEIQQHRTERMKIEQQRNKCNVINDKNNAEEDYELNIMDDLKAIPNLSGLSRLQTDPLMEINKDADQKNEVQTVENKIK